MGKTILLVLLLATSAMASPPAWHQLNSSYSFEQYTKDFKKSYASTAEYEKRRNLFNLKLKTVLAFNEAGTATWKKGINHLSDRTPAELKAMNGALAKRTVTTPLTAPRRDYKMTGKAIPDSYDWRYAYPPVLTAVKDQGQCGSCWAHAATEEVESMNAIRHGLLFTLSQQQLTSCVANTARCGGTGGCNGATAEVAFDYLANVGGQTEEWMYGYQSYFGEVPSCQFNPSQTTPFVKVKGYTLLPRNNQLAVMDAIANIGPLAISVDASEWSDYAEGIFSGCDYRKNITMDHAVQLVGYGHDIMLNKDYWIVRNSWSATFGEKGYIRLLKEDTPTCGWDTQWGTEGGGCKGDKDTVWSCGMCGILFDTLFPNV
eukprot:Tbor_TRINITY_DN5826_c1_g3::TRINITY_DN5826_c1_g3_i1::g.6086::m.6086